MTKTLVFAGSAPAARQSAQEHGVAWSDVIYVSSPRVLRGMRTRDMPRIFGHGGGDRPDFEELESLLALYDSLG